MIRSMTGYGRGEYIEDDRQVVVEISAVNNRYLDLNIRMPRAILFFEEDIRRYIKGHISRGKLDIYINYKSQSKEDINLVVNEALCKEYVDTLRSIQKQYGLIDDISTMQVASFTDIIKIEQQDIDKEHVWYIIQKALEEAVGALNTMREQEGRTLKEDLYIKGEQIHQMIGNINERTPLVVDQYEERLYQRIVETIDNVNIEPDPNRILTEVAIFSDRSSIDEELIRLGSHMAQLKDILDRGGVVGRKLDFLLQEINREINTIGSKTTDELVTKCVIDLKSEAEKIREQVQNIE